MMIYCAHQKSWDAFDMWPSSSSSSWQCSGRTLTWTCTAREELVRRLDRRAASSAAGRQERGTHSATRRSPSGSAPSAIPRPYQCTPTYTFSAKAVTDTDKLNEAEQPITQGSEVSCQAGRRPAGAEDAGSQQNILVPLYLHTC